jgi:lysophospholipase L1-like esterase
MAAALDAVVILLGTNDLFLPWPTTADQVARGVGALVACARSSDAGPGGGAPAVVVLIPPPFGPLGAWARFSPNGIAESQRSSETFPRLAEEQECTILALGSVESSPIDGVHFGLDAHGRIGIHVAAALREVLEPS